ncbi:hypothetical protein CDD81_3157 [Ophiocordyceps australis]|uniref:Integral membrane protein n=1 Tax=Ophiocordyceps australis TaxID=1399860 RepID=A0A2C5XWK3_9HYPO|nr:hypothetical protein CDD81_3157 [Ophiocordyceps australis]
MGVGRFACVALPLLLILASIIALLVATLSGVTHHSMHMFRVNVSELSINPASIGNIASKLGVNLEARLDAIQTDNITAGNLGLNDTYDINLWGYCTTDRDGRRHCTKAQFDWATHKLNTTWIENFGAVAGVHITLPDEVQSALRVFRTVTRWTEVAFIVALVALGVEFFVGILANMSRVISCLTWFISIVAVVLVGAAAGLATATASIVIGAIEGTAKYYGVRGSIDTSFLAAVWIATAFALGAAFFWIFTICCCKPERRNRGAYRSTKHASSDDEKLLPSRGYAPLGNDREMSGGAYYEGNNQHHMSMAPPLHSPQPPSYSGANERANMAYEPYSHRV